MTILTFAFLVWAAATAPSTTHAHATSMKPAISADSAQAIALARVPRAHVRSRELERENGLLIYSFDLKVPGRSGIDEVNVDAMSGRVVAVSHEGPKAERREKALEKREKTSHRP